MIDTGTVQLRVFMTCHCGSGLEILVHAVGMTEAECRAAIDEVHETAQPCWRCQDAGITVPPLSGAIRALIFVGRHEEAQRELDALAERNPARFAAVAPAVWRTIDRGAFMSNAEARVWRFLWSPWAERHGLVPPPIDAPAWSKA